jgi:hypothetical protein
MKLLPESVNAVVFILTTLFSVAISAISTTFFIQKFKNFLSNIPDDLNGVFLFLIFVIFFTPIVILVHFIAYKLGLIMWISC